MVKADPTVANLRDKNYFFYEYGKYIATKFQIDTKSNIADFLGTVFLERVKKILMVILHINEEMGNNNFL